MKRIIGLFVAAIMLASVLCMPAYATNAGSDSPDQSVQAEVQVRVDENELIHKYSVDIDYADVIVFTYTKEGKILKPDNVSHPLLSESMLTYEWYKDGVATGDGAPELRLINVTDSGLYALRLSLSHGNQTVSITTPSVKVTINKAEIEIPSIPPQYYTGELLYPELYSTTLYNVIDSCARDAGTYPIKLEVKDCVNYVFINGKTEAYSDFKIISAPNYWMESLKILDIYVGMDL